VFCAGGQRSTARLRAHRSAVCPISFTRAHSNLRPPSLPSLCRRFVVDINDHQNSSFLLTRRYSVLQMYVCVPPRSCSDIKAATNSDDDDEQRRRRTTPKEKEEQRRRRRRRTNKRTNELTTNFKRRRTSFKRLRTNVVLFHYFQYVQYSFLSYAFIH